MNTQRRIIAVMYLWIAGGLAVAFIGLGIAVKVQSARLATAKAATVAVQGKFDAFVSQAKALGDAQAARTKALDQANADLKEKVDETNAKSRADLAALYAKYRGVLNARPNTNSGSLPPAATVTSSASRTCFDTAKLAGAVGVLEAGVPGITEQGDVARLRLSTSVEWARSIGH